MKTSIEFTIHGQARPQGSKRAYAMRTKDGRSIARVVDDNPHLKDWRQQIAATALQAWGESPLDLSVPVMLSLQFVRQRPASHYGSGRNSGKLKASAPACPTSRPDTLKLGRAVEDALTGIVWTDDSQVVRHELSKSYGDRHCVVVRVEVIEVPPCTAP